MIHPRLELMMSDESFPRQPQVGEYREGSEWNNHFPRHTEMDENDSINKANYHCPLTIPNLTRISLAGNAIHRKRLAVVEQQIVTFRSSVLRFPQLATSTSHRPGNRVQPSDHVVNLVVPRALELL